jgi:hypothetical protein
MQRHNPFGEDFLEIRGNPALPSAKKFPLLSFEFHTRQSTTNFQKPKTTQKLRCSVFFKKEQKVIQ